jgi:hypothetical protein
VGAVRLAKVSQVLPRGNTKLTFGRRVPSRCIRACRSTLSRGESARAACRRPHGERPSAHGPRPTDPQPAGTSLRQFATPKSASTSIRLSRLAGLLATSPVFVDFRRCRMPGLPMLSDRHGSEGTEPKPQRSTKRQPRPRCSSLSGHDPRRHEGPRPTRPGTSKGRKQRHAAPHRRCCGNDTKREDWRACDEGLHNWTGREDL